MMETSTVSVVSVALIEHGHVGRNAEIKKLTISELKAYKLTI
jgi:hypothetical protein